MKIAFLVDVINEKSGARAPIKIILGLCRLKERVTVFSYRTGLDPEVEKKLLQAGAEVVFVESPNGRLGKYLTALRLTKPLKAGNFDLIACHSSLPFFYAARMVGKPIIYTYYGTQLTSYNTKLISETPLSYGLKDRVKFYFLDRLILFLEKRRILACDAAVAISKSTAKEVEKLYGRKIDYIYLGADLESKKGFPQPSKSDELMLLSVSRIVPYKGFHRLFQAFKSIRKEVGAASLTIIGTNHNSAYLKYLQATSPKGAKILLNVTDEVLAEYYQKCAVYVSQTTWEGFGLPFLEAQNYGKPVVGFANTSIPEIIKDGETGFLAESQKEFIEKVTQLLKNKALREKMGKEATTFANSFTWDKCAKDYQKYFQKFLKGVS